MTLRTTFLVDTSVSAAAIFEPLVEDILIPIANELQRKSTADCLLRFGLHTFPEGGCIFSDGDSLRLQNSLRGLTLSGGASDGREPLLPAINSVLSALPDDPQLFHALCIASDAFSFTEVAQDKLSFFVPSSLLSIVFLHHPDFKGLLHPRSRIGWPLSLSLDRYVLDDALRDQTADIARNLSDTLLTNSNLPL